jgi:hypothetical protein
MQVDPPEMSSADALAIVDAMDDPPVRVCSFISLGTTSA